MESIIIELNGRIDSNNVAGVEEDIMRQLEGAEGKEVVLDAEKLEYISSAGLRTMLRIKKKFKELRITNVSPEVYDIFEMTGFTEMITVEKAYRKISVEGCEVIGEGANGKVYRIDQDNVVKTYKNADALPAIQHEREVAKLAFVLGIPTAISYDVVKVGDSYGSVFELLNSSSFAKILAEQPEKFSWCVDEFVGMLGTIHETHVPEGKLPRLKEKAVRWCAGMKHFVSAEHAAKLEKMIAEIPEADTMIHGDYHTKNIVLAGDEVLIIDMDTLSVGHPILEFIQIYCSLIGFSEYDHAVVENFQGFSYETSEAFWRNVVFKYFEGRSYGEIKAIEDKIRVLSYVRLLDWSRRHKPEGNAEGEAERSCWLKELEGLMDSVDNLYFDTEAKAGNNSAEIDVEALKDNLPQVLSFVDEHLENMNCSMKAQMQIAVAVEEIFVNIASYAYEPEKGGRATVRVEVDDDPLAVIITFMDNGIPYDPLAKEDPDITLSAEERGIGGLGIFMTKQFMDDITYEYKDGMNILKLKKNI